MEVKMAVVKIEEVFLYVSEVAANAAENIEAMAFMDHSGIPYTKMMYNDPSVIDQVLEPLNTWWRDRGVPDATGFPLLTYVEIHDDIPARMSPACYLQGISEIKKIVDIYNATNA